MEKRRRHGWKHKKGEDVERCVRCGAMRTFTTYGVSPAVLRGKKEPYCGR